jgi:hypothetical protein
MAVEPRPLTHLQSLMDAVRLSSHPVEAIRPIMLWRVHERGRVAHRVSSGGVASCGEQGTRWRSVAGIPSCPDCEQSGAGPG